MRKKSKIKTIIIILAIIFTIAAFNNLSCTVNFSNNDGELKIRNETLLKRPEGSGDWTTNFIHIDNNWSDTATTYDWCSGDGSWGNPYTIENVTIDASTSPTESGIFIVNSEKEYFVIRNCTVYNSGSSFYDAGIRLENTNNGTLINNNCSVNGQSGIFLYDNCENNTILGNILNDNNNGIYFVWECDSNTISGNIANDNQCGIHLQTQCWYNRISGNTVNNNNDAGIRVEDNSHHNIVTGNNANSNVNHGIIISGLVMTIGCKNNIVSNNAANDGGGNGITVEWLSNNNTISGNTANNNSLNGIYLWSNCVNNTISGNTVNDNSGDGIWLRDHCENNTISGNTANNNTERGLTMSLYCANNIILGNTANNNNYYGILLSNYCNNNTVSNNIANENNPGGIYLWNYCDDNTVSGNNINDSSEYGMNLYRSNNNSISGNIIYYNNLYGVLLDSECDDNLFYLNVFIGNVYHARDEGTNNHWNTLVIGNYWDNHTSPDSDNDGIVDISYTWITGSADSEDNLPLVESPIHLGDTIHIDNSGISAPNWSRTAELNFWCTGSGNYSDPFIIEGLEIDAGESGSCILIENSYVYFIIRNCKVYNSGILTGNAGIRLQSVMHGTLTNNNCSNNSNRGIYLLSSSYNNITGNTVNNNSEHGIYIYIDCYNNIISGNSVNNNSGHGIYIYFECYNNIISGNTVNNNSGYGILIYIDCYNNIISGNTANNNLYAGIILWNCDDNTISGNTVSENLWGIYLYDNCVSNIISGNTANNNSQHGIILGSDDCDDNLIYLNEFIENGVNAIDDGNNYWDNGTIGNYWDDYTGLDKDGDGIGDTPYIVPSRTPGYNVDFYPIWDIPYFKLLFVEISDQSFSTEEFNITFYISNETNHGIDFTTIQMWWNGVEVSTSIQNLGNGLYFVSLEPITVLPGEDPILLSMIISADGYQDKYFETYLAVEPQEIVKFLQVEISDHSYSLEHFNLTFFVCDEAEQGIDSATIQIWWNGVDVSGSIINLGNGFYFVSLDPITVAPGEDPILLNMFISANGYQDKSFETYLAVDPDTLEKDVGKPAEEFPLTIIIIAVISIVGGIGIAGISMVLLRKKKRPS